MEQNIGLFINEVVSFNTNQTDQTNDSFEQSVISMEIEKFRMKNEKSIIKKTESLQPLSTEEKINLSSTESINDSGLSHQSPLSSDIYFICKASEKNISNLNRLSF